MKVQPIPLDLNQIEPMAMRFQCSGVRHLSYAEQETQMFIRTAFAATITAAALLTASGCAVIRGQESTGAYVSDAGITATVKARFVENKAVDASSISVETLNGTVMLSGFAKNAAEKSMAESLARGVSGVKAVKNEISLRP
jgi:osmotically-inducible protein OsmY